ncbi:hypothetical protein GCM10011393_20800 [Sphingopyxis bauzanensis]|nr:hypothetical protein GCM10011393_20800 [Sphingopyxis bauzanensis]
MRIPVHEANRARLVSCEALDAWSAYHLGLQRMFRFTAGDNAAAAALFTRAIANAPGFARGYAGLSFTRFQDAFLNYADRATATAAARDTAEKAVALDPLDPFANLAMGRAYWLSGDLEGSLAWLDRSSALSPNYAQATYARAWAETLLSRSDDGLRHADQALALSPVDPMRYAMLATRSLSHLVRGEDVLAVVWAERAAREPGAHALIAVIAAACQAGIGDTGRAKVWIDIARRRHPALTRDAFFQSFPFSEPVFRSRMQVLLDRSGLR